MFALPPKADIGTQPRDVCFVPKADIGHLFDHLVGDSHDPRWDRKALRFGRLEVDYQFERGRLDSRQI